MSTGDTSGKSQAAVLFKVAVYVRTCSQSTENWSIKVPAATSARQSQVTFDESPGRRMSKGMLFQSPARHHPTLRRTQEALLRPLQLLWRSYGADGSQAMPPKLLGTGICLDLVSHLQMGKQRHEWTRSEPEDSFFPSLWKNSCAQLVVLSIGIRSPGAIWGAPGNTPSAFSHGSCHV